VACRVIAGSFLSSFGEGACGAAVQDPIQMQVEMRMIERVRMFEWARFQGGSTVHFSS